MKVQRTTGEYRHIKRWEHDEIMDKVQQRLDRMPKAMTVASRRLQDQVPCFDRPFSKRRSR